MTDTYPAPQSSGGPNPSGHTEEIKSAVRDAGEAGKAAMADMKTKLSEQGGEKVDAATNTAGDSLRQVADQLRQAGDNLGEEQGWARQAFSQGAEGLERVSGYLREGRLDDFTRDLQSFARSNPAAFLAGSVAIGFLAARMAKTATERATHQAASEQTDRQSHEPSSTSASSFEEPRSFSPTPDVAAGPYPGGSF
jgi:hypothetical protein